MSAQIIRVPVIVKAEFKNEKTAEHNTRIGVSINSQNTQNARENRIEFVCTNGIVYPYGEWTRGSDR